MQELRKLFKLLSPYKGLLGISIGFQVLMALFTIISIPLIIPFFHFLFATRPDVNTKPEGSFDLVAWLEYYFVDFIGTYGEEKTLIITCLFIIVTFFLKNLFRYLSMYFIIPVRSNIVRDLRDQLYDSYVRYNDKRSRELTRGDLLTRISGDVQEIEWNMLRFVDTLFKSPIIIIGAVALMLSIHKGLTLFVFLLMVFTGAVIGSLSKKLKHQSQALQERLSDINVNIDSTLDGQLLINLHNVISVWKSRFSRINQNFKLQFDKVNRRQELSSPLSEFLGVSVVVLLLFYGAKLVMSDQLQAATFFAFVLAFYHVIEPLKTFSTAFYYIKKGAASLERIESVTQDTPDIKKEIRSDDIKLRSSIKMQNISFAFDDLQVLNDISIEIPKSSKIALVGPSGSGKSTIVKLLLGLLKPQTGTISIDDKVLNQEQLAHLYNQIGYVTQDAFLYADTLRNNILLGRDGYSDEDILKVLSLAQAHFVIERLPNGLDTVLSDRGKSLSGGEQQRISIARALLGDPEILILDEPSSALDPETENALSQTILKVLEDRTAIIIAHRISTIKFVDNIFVIDNGEIKEQGKHKDLIDKSGVYAEYVRIQNMD